MADELVQINNNKENILEFDLSVDGLNANQVDAKFIIRSADMDFAFPCTKDENGKWMVKLPALPMLERTTYPCHFQVVAEGYHFTPYKGSITVVGSSDVYITQPKSKFGAPTTGEKIEESKPAVKVEVPKAVPTKSREKSISQIAQELMESQKKEVKPSAPRLAEHVEQPVEAPVVVKESLLPKITVEAKEEKHGGSKDAAARAVLESMGMSVDKKKKLKRVFSSK